MTVHVFSMIALLDLCHEGTIRVQISKASATAPVIEALKICAGAELWQELCQCIAAVDARYVQVPIVADARKAV